MKVIFIDENGNEVTDIMEYNATDVIRDGDIISSREFFENLTDSDAVHGAYDMSGAEIMELRMENVFFFMKEVTREVIWLHQIFRSLQNEADTPPIRIPWNMTGGRSTC